MVAPIIGHGSDATSRAVGKASGPATATRASTETRTEAQAVIRTPADAFNVLRARMEQRLEQAMGALANKPSVASHKYSAQAQPPTPTDVANRILGFVQNRLQAEAEAGADTERLTELFAQARAGIEKGYGEAREQIQALGLMTETLAVEIDKGFDLIQDGLLNLEKLFLEKETE